MFDVTAFGEYNSDNSRNDDHSQPGYDEPEEENGEPIDPHRNKQSNNSAECVHSIYLQSIFL